jgi:NADH-quinone oxidoreductase subunit M
MQMLAHGFVTAAIFCLIGMIYARTHTRMIPEMSGLMARMPFLGTAFVIAGFAALGLPGLAGFAAELNIFLGGFAAESPGTALATAIALLSIVVSAIYILRATNKVFNGPPLPGASHAIAAPDPGAHAHADAGGLERAAILILLACILAMGLMPGPIAALIDQSLRPILANLSR